MTIEQLKSIPAGSLAKHHEQFDYLHKNGPILPPSIALHIQDQIINHHEEDALLELHRLQREYDK